MKKSMSEESIKNTVALTFIEQVKGTINLQQQVTMLVAHVATQTALQILSVTQRDADRCKSLAEFTTGLKAAIDKLKGE